MTFAHSFEELYYQRKESRIHFICQSIHLLTHIAPETFRVGPLACYAQWTLETAIRNLGQEIRQDRDMFANLTQCAVLCAQTNSLQSFFPSIQLEFGEPGSSLLSTRARQFDGYVGYAFHPRCKEYPNPVAEDKREALIFYWHAQGWPNADTWTHAVCCWAKLQLPNGQIACLLWHEMKSQADCIELRASR